MEFKTEFNFLNSIVKFYKYTINSVNSFNLKFKEFS